MVTPIETEKYIRFQLEHLADRNEHHVFEEIAFHIASRRLSSNIVPATGPVSAGGDQGRDAESYYTSLPAELPGAGGFVAGASTRSWVMAASIQKAPLDQKVRGDLKTICTAGSPVERVAFFAVYKVPVKKRHDLQGHAREMYSVELEVFDGLAVSRMLSQADLLWIAQRYLDLPAVMIPDQPAAPRPDWYRDTLNALRHRTAPRLTPGTLSEVRDGLRHATFDDEARVDLPEWLRYISEFAASPIDELALTARYERTLAMLRGRNSLDGVEPDIHAVVDAALASDRLALLDDAATLLGFWGGAWLRHIGTASPQELRSLTVRLRDHVNTLADAADPDVYAVRKAGLLSLTARLCLQPKWDQIHRPGPGQLSTPQEVTRRFREDPDIVLDVDPAMIDATEAMDALEAMIDLLPRAAAVALGPTTTVFQLLAPALTDDPRYETIRDALDQTDATITGENGAAERCQNRARAFLNAGRPLDALHELHTAKIKWWHGDSLRNAITALRLIADLYADLRLCYAAKQYALTAAALASNAGDLDLQDEIPAALADVHRYAYDAGAWADALALGGLAFNAHHLLAENAEDYDAHPYLPGLDFHLGIALLSVERFRPDNLAAVRQFTNADDADNIDRMLEVLRPAFTLTEAQFIASTDEQLAGRPFTDAGPQRTLAFAALGTTWFVTCTNTRDHVLAAERFTAALQILLAELARLDPVLFTQDVHAEITLGTPLRGGDRVRFQPDNTALRCRLMLSPYDPDVSTEQFERDLATDLAYLLAHLSARPTDTFMDLVHQVFARGLLHKMHVGRPYDETAALLPEDHYTSLGAITMQPFDTPRYQPAPASQIQPPTTPGPGYSRDTAQQYIRENYEELPQLLAVTLPRLLTDPTARGHLEELRDQGWLDWQILVAISNVAAMARARLAAGRNSDPNMLTSFMRSFFDTPEHTYPDTLPLAAFTADRLRKQMDATLLSIGKRRWNLRTAVPTPNITAFHQLLVNRYGYGQDDVPHRDLLREAINEDGTVSLHLGA